MGRLTWEQAEALVDRAYNPDRHLHLHPSIRMIKVPMVETAETRAFGEEFMRKLRKRIEESDQA